MKKFLAFAAAGVLCLSAAGCGSKDIVEDTVKEIEKVADEAKDEAEDAVDEVTEAVDKVIPEVAVPDSLLSTYDTGLIMDEDAQMYLPYDSSKFDFDDSITESLDSDDLSIYAWTFDTEEKYQSYVDDARAKAESGEDKAEVEDMTIGEYNVVALTYDFLGWQTEYYVDFDGKFGDIPGAYVCASAYSGDKETTKTEEIKDMIANIFVVE